MSTRTRLYGGHRQPGGKPAHTSTCAVIPTHNEEETTGYVVTRTRRHVDHVLVIHDESRTDDFEAQALF